MKTRYKIHRLFYNIISKIYDLCISVYFNKEETNPRNAVAKLITENDKTLLDICAGTCQNSIKIAKSNSNIKVTAIDRSVKMLDVARHKILKDNISNIDLKAMDATNLKLENKGFDVVVISLVLHELEEITQQKILLEIHRVLKDEGKFIVVEWDRPKTVGRKVKFAFIELIEPKSYKKLMQQDMKIYFEKVGFEIDNTVLCDYTKIYKLKKAYKQ
ncbi:MAG: methyltransferase domain-containing protein [Chitinispirillales bacterium]|jgi:ubiquinone/menaquinone biosynthesis C-methylase UbiE|nr:methyltransferase domain-containing protein [Chitinispirillales bacterium]